VAVNAQGVGDGSDDSSHWWILPGEVGRFRRGRNARDSCVVSSAGRYEG
jgi:hypothetical protein